MSREQFADRVGIVAEMAFASGDWRGFFGTLSGAAQARYGETVLVEAFTTCLQMAEA